MPRFALFLGKPDNSIENQVHLTRTDPTDRAAVTAIGRQWLEDSPAYSYATIVIAETGWEILRLERQGEEIVAFAAQTPLRFGDDTKLGRHQVRFVPDGDLVVLETYHGVLFEGHRYAMTPEEFNAFAAYVATVAEALG